MALLVGVVILHDGFYLNFRWCTLRCAHFVRGVVLSFTIRHSCVPPAVRKLLPSTGSPDTLTLSLVSQLCHLSCCFHDAAVDERHVTT